MSQRKTYLMKVVIYIYNELIHRSRARGTYAVKMNQMIKRERKKTRKGKINSIYMLDKQCYLKF